MHFNSRYLRLFCSDYGVSFGEIKLYYTQEFDITTVVQYYCPCRLFTNQNDTGEETSFILKIILIQEMLNCRN